MEFFILYDTPHFVVFKIVHFEFKNMIMKGAEMSCSKTLNVHVLMKKSVSHTFFVKHISVDLVYPTRQIYIILHRKVC